MLLKRSVIDGAEFHTVFCTNESSIDLLLGFTLWTQRDIWSVQGRTLAGYPSSFHPGNAEGVNGGTLWFGIIMHNASFRYCVSDC
jgi:hypothetical protein